MKYFYLLGCVFFSIKLCAQDITPEIDAKLQLLDKNYITTDILYDRVFPLANLSEFNQVNSDTSQINHFYRAYSEIQRADYNNRWQPVKDVTTNVVVQTNAIPIGI